jgi:hypothetical protein
MGVAVVVEEAEEEEVTWNRLYGGGSGG